VTLQATPATIAARTLLALPALLAVVMLNKMEQAKVHQN
jgi:hypothetical protein